MDSMWALRSAYNEARKVKLAQDAFCSKAEAGLWDSIGNEFPENLQWEALIDVLRGRVKVRGCSYLSFNYPTDDLGKDFESLLRVCGSG